MNAHDAHVRKRTARLFRNGRSQAVRIPKEWEFEGDEVTIERGENDTLTIQPARPRRTPREMVEWLKSLPRLSDDDFPVIDDSDMSPLDDVDL